MKIDPEIAAFLAALKQQLAEDKTPFKDLDDQQLESLQLEIAEDPEIEKAIRKILE